MAVSSSERMSTSNQRLPPTPSMSYRSVVRSRAGSIAKSEAERSVYDDVPLVMALAPDPHHKQDNRFYGGLNRSSGHIVKYTYNFYHKLMDTCHCCQHNVGGYSTLSLLTASLTVVASAEGTH
jgi:hypothetical protein